GRHIRHLRIRSISQWTIYVYTWITYCGHILWMRAQETVKVRVLRGAKCNEFSRLHALLLSMKVVRSHFQSSIRESDQAGRFDVDHVVLILEGPFDKKELAAGDHKPVLVVEI